VALIAFITAVWLSLYMGWAIHSLRLIPRFTNTLLACCGREYEVRRGSLCAVVAVTYGMRCVSAAVLEQAVRGATMVPYAHTCARSLIQQGTVPLHVSYHDVVSRFRSGHRLECLIALHACCVVSRRMCTMSGSRTTGWESRATALQPAPAAARSPSQGPGTQRWRRGR
jgi:hypothetical protein